MKRLSDEDRLLFKQEVDMIRAAHLDHVGRPGEAIKTDEVPEIFYADSLRRKSWRTEDVEG